MAGQVRCDVCDTFCRANSRGEPKTHFPRHQPRYDAAGQPVYCPGGDG